MKVRTKTVAALATLALPAAFGAVMLFHPGVALAAPRFLGWQKQADLPQEGVFTPDQMHTSIGFDVDHMGLSKIQGRFTKFTGRIVANRAVAGSSVEFTIQTDSVDTAVAPRDADLRSANFFDVAQYPEMTYRSTSVRKSGKGYVCEGNLTLHGVTKPVALPFRLFGPVKDYQGKQRIGIIVDPVTIKRSEFGMGKGITAPGGGPGVGDPVIIRLSLEASMDK